MLFTAEKQVLKKTLLLDWISCRMMTSGCTRAVGIMKQWRIPFGQLFNIAIQYSDMIFFSWQNVYCIYTLLFLLGIQHHSHEALFYRREAWIRPTASPSLWHCHKLIVCKPIHRPLCSHHLKLVQFCARLTQHKPPVRLNSIGMYFWQAFSRPGFE